MLELRIIAGRQAVPVFDLPAALGRRGAAKEIGDQIEALIAFMDDLGADPDLEEDNEDAEHCGREPDEDAQGEMAWIEWHSRSSHKLGGGAEVVGRDWQGLLIHEDAEDDDPAEEDSEDRCEAADDEVTSGAAPVTALFATSLTWSAARMIRNHRGAGVSLLRLSTAPS